MAQALQPDPRGDWLRMLGGVVLAVGAAILFARKSDDWAAFPLLLVAAIPCALVFGVGALAALATGAVGRWHAVLMVAGVLLFSLGLVAYAVIEGETPDRSLAGWPLILLLIGAGALAAGRL
ncbi:MAG: hypothetical protein ACRDM0_18625, partial [Thermoleophilaceae bacterium]